MKKKLNFFPEKEKLVNFGMIQGFTVKNLDGN